MGFLSRVARDGKFDVGLLRSGLGRLCFVVGALEWERPFLAPLYVYLARQPKRGLRQLPLYVRLVAQYLAARVSLRRSYPSAVERRKGVEPFRIDASAEGDSIGVGGWMPARNASGNLDVGQSRWFALTLNQSTAPWAYLRGQPFRAVAALEAVAVLIGLVVFGPHLTRDSDQLYSMPSLTDNKGNQHTITRLQSSKFPLCAILMEIAARSESLGIRLAVEWIPREMNAEADKLAGGQFTGFNPSLRQVIHWPSIHWLVLDWVLEQGTAYHREAGQTAGAERERTPSRTCLKAPAFKQVDPW